MNNNQTENQDPYEELLKGVEESKEIQRLNRKYKHKSYRDKNRWIYNLCIFLIFFCQSTSIVTASTFLFSSLLGKMSGFSYAFEVSLIIAGIVLLSLEIATGLFYIRFFEDYYKNNRIRKSMSMVIACIVILGSLSNYWSYSGGFDLPKVVQSKPIKQTPPPPDYNEIKNRYNSLAEKARKDAEDYKSSRLYLGKLRHEEGETYSRMKKNATAFEEEMNEELKSAENKYNKDLENAEIIYQSDTEQWNIKSNKDGSGLSKIAITAYLIMVLCYGYKEKYEYTIHLEYKNKTENAKPTPTQNQNVFIPSTKQSHTQKNLSATQKPKPATQKPHSTENTGKNTQTQAEYATQIPVEYSPALSTVSVSSDQHPTLYSRSKSSLGVIELDGKLKIHHAGLDKSKTHRDYYFTVVDIKGKIRNYSKRITAALANFQRDKSDRNKRTLDNNEIWKKYWEDRVKEFEK